MFRSSFSRAYLLPAVCLGTALHGACAAGQTGPPRPTKKFVIECKPETGGNVQYEAEFWPGTKKNPVDALTVTFKDRKPSSADAEQVLRACVSAATTAVRIDYEMLVNAFFNDDGPLPLGDGSTSLAYDPKTAKVQTWNERQGIRPSLAKGAGYTVEYEEHKIAVPPYAKVASIQVLFQSPPKQPNDVLTILKAEVEKAVRKQPTKLDTTAYAQTGPASDRIAQKQIRGPKGQYLRLEFHTKSGQIRDQDDRLWGTIR